MCRKVTRYEKIFTPRVTFFAAVRQKSKTNAEVELFKNFKIMDGDHIVAITAILIPILLMIGLFTSISLNIYFKYKTNTVLSERLPGESLIEWHRANAITRVQAREKRGRNTGLRIGGLMVGIGIGVAIGCIALACGAVSNDNMDFDSDVIAVFLVISLAIFCGGVGMVGAYFLERNLDGKRRQEK